MKLISLHASICAGKTSLMKIVRQNYNNVLTIPENIDSWKEGLKKWYNEKTQESLVELQDIIYSSFVDNYNSIVENQDKYDFIILERSPIDTAEIFLDFNREVLGEYYYKYYYDQALELEEKINTFNRTKIYIKSNISLILERSALRDKGIIENDYLQGVFNKYEDKFSKDLVTITNNGSIVDMFNTFRKFLV